MLKFLASAQLWRGFMNEGHDETKREFEALRKAILSLSSLAELEIPTELQLPPDESTTPSKDTSQFSYLNRKLKPEDATIAAVKETFKTILEHLRRLHKKQRGKELSKALQHGIDTIMVLVGEAASKLDRYTSIFKKVHKGEGITSLKEYKDLQEYYRHTFVKKNVERAPSKESSKQLKARIEAEETEEEGKEGQVLFEIDEIKRDGDYELLYLRRENGSFLYQPSLIKKMQIASEVSGYVGESAGDDPYIQIKSWEDKRLYDLAMQLLQSIKNFLPGFYQGVKRNREVEVSVPLNKILMALMLACNPQNLIRQFSVKSCAQYFFDFQAYLRALINSDSYRGLLDENPPKGSFSHLMVNLVRQLCEGLFTNTFAMQEVGKGLSQLIQRGYHESKIEGRTLSLSEAIEADYKALDSLLRQYPSGPLLKDLEVVSEKNKPPFDPLFLDNYPYELFSLSLAGNKMYHLRLPCPTTQELINQAKICEEFKEFVRDHEKPKSILLINLQDRTSWKESARCTALERLQKGEAVFENYLTVVTLAKSSKFYYQLAPYQDLNLADLFLKEFKSHLIKSNEVSFPDRLKGIFEEDFIEQLLQAVHAAFFSSKEMLSRRERLDLIEVTYLFIQLKLLEEVKPDYFTLSCKDALDIGAVSSVQLFLFLKMIQGSSLTDEEKESVRLMLFVPAFMLRHRLIDQDRLNRMLNVIKLLELKEKNLAPQPFKELIQEHFGPLFESEILKSVPKLVSESPV